MGKMKAAASWKTYLKIDVSVLTQHEQVFRSLLPENGLRPENERQCALCGTILSTKQNRQQHEKQHTGLAAYSCLICGEKKLSLGVIWTHISRHLAKDKTLTVSRKDQQETTTTATANKSKKELYEVIPMTVGDEEKSIFEIGGGMALMKKKCNVCGEEPEDLKRHYRLHTGLCPYRCRMCGGEFPFKKDVKRHIAKHSGEEKENFFLNLRESEEKEVTENLRPEIGSDNRKTRSHVSNSRTPLHETASPNSLFMTPPTSDYKETPVLRRFPKTEPAIYRRRKSDQSLEEGELIDSPTDNNQKSSNECCSEDCTCNFPIRTQAQIKFEDYDSYEEKPVISLAAPPNAMTPDTMNGSWSETELDSGLVIEESEQNDASLSRTDADINNSGSENQKETSGKSDQTAPQQEVRVCSPASRDLDEIINKALDYLASGPQNENRKSLESVSVPTRNMENTPPVANSINFPGTSKKNLQTSTTTENNSIAPGLTHFQETRNPLVVNQPKKANQASAPPPPPFAPFPCYQPPPNMTSSQWCQPFPQTTNYNFHPSIMYNNNMSCYMQPPPAPSTVNRHFFPTPPRRNPMVNFNNYYQPHMSQMGGLSQFNNFLSGNYSASAFPAVQQQNVGQFLTQGFHPYKRM